MKLLHGARSSSNHMAPTSARSPTTRRKNNGLVVMISSLLLFSSSIVLVSGQDFVLDSPVGSHDFGDVITDIQSVAGDDRLFVVTRRGRIDIVVTSGNTVLPTPFLDIDANVQNCASIGCEMGLLGLAFHPNYSDADNGYFFVHYTNNGSDSVIARYRRSTADANVADPTSGTILKTVTQPRTNHNGGQLQFGKNDGMLYIAFGDGGGSYDRAESGNLGVGQKTDSLLGKMLRVDVDNFALSEWNIPSDNPYVNDGSVLDEIWALGLRNPWRFSFDRLTGDMYIADVGQGAIEEVNFQSSSSTGGENYGWCVCEAFNQVNPNTYLHCAAPSGFNGCDMAPFTPPIFDYPHSGGGSITGGYVYRGNNYPNMVGTYFYGDYVQDFVRGAAFLSSTWTIDAWETTDSMTGTATTFGEDSNGEMYVGTTLGRLYSIRDATVSPPTDTPSVSPTAPTSVPSSNPTRAPFDVSVGCPGEYQVSKNILPGELDLEYSVVTSSDESRRLLGCTTITRSTILPTPPLIHDIDHPGVPNPQLIKEDGRLAGMYKSRSVAKQNSFDIAWETLMDDAFESLRETICITPSEQRRFRQLVINSVMATDLGDKELKELRNGWWDRAFADSDSSVKEDDDQRDSNNRKATILIEHLIQAADVAHTCQHWSLYRKWNKRLFQECYKAYRDGRAETNPADGWYQGELGFYDFYIIPLARKLRDCSVFGPTSNENLDYAKNN